MKIISTALISLLLLSLSHVSHAAVTSTGTIKRIKVCGTGETNGNRWVNALLFQISDDQWFVIPGNFITNGTTYSNSRDLDGNLYHSTILMAYSMNHPIEVSSASNWNVCGINANQIWGYTDDYVELVK